jgi:hypothetical protein
VIASLVAATTLVACSTGHSGSYIDGYNYGVGWVNGSGPGGSNAGPISQATAISNCTRYSVYQVPQGDTGSDWIAGCTDAESSGATTQLRP